MKATSPSFALHKPTALPARLAALGLLALALAACGSPAAAPTQTVAPSATAEPYSTPTEESSPTPEATPTVNIDALPKSEVAQLLAEGHISYPEHWNNEQRREFGIAMAEYVNTEVGSDKAYVEMNFPEIGDTKLAWSPNYGYWRSSHNTPESQLDLTGESFSPLFIAGYTNTEGQEVFINPQGQEVVVPKISMPGLGEVSITDLYKMNLNDLKNYVINTMLGANGMADQGREYVQARRNNHFPLPVVIYENADQNEKIYAYQDNSRSTHAQIPEAEVIFRSWRTNSVLMPILDPGSDQLIGWVSIQQGLRNGGMASFPFASGENPNSIVTHEIGDQRAFGADANHFFGIVLLGKTTRDTYKSPENLFLENASNIGSEAEIQRILNAKSVMEIMQILADLRFFATYPDLYLYPTNK
ncbi:MAG: hypothetical protein KF701_07250 [Anaerolineales bacterium]|nr:MAG: hypothetical protein KF701_07250 [Anaerolineales bacterium]